MSVKTFAINTAPHVAKIGSTELLFQPEVIGADFMAAYSELSGAQKTIAALKDDAEPKDLAHLTEAMRSFVAKLLLDDEAIKVFNGLKLPDRVLVQLIEWTAEIYGGSAGKDENTGRSSGS